MSKPIYEINNEIHQSVCNITDKLRHKGLSEAQIDAVVDELRKFADLIAQQTRYNCAIKPVYEFRDPFLY